MYKIIYCPVCGSNIRFHKICPACSYQMDRDYEIYPTLEVIPRHCESIPSKRRNWEKQQLKKDMDDLLQSLRSEMREQVSELENRISKVESGSKIPVGGTASVPVTESKQALITINNNTCIYGSYPQDADGTVSPILWQVLEVDKTNNKALLISKYALDCQPYNTTRTDITWETSSIREWLNGIFLSTAFSDEERAMILKVTVNAETNPDYITNQGNSTKDQIFLLSTPDAGKYFSTAEERRCASTAYAVKKGAWISGKYRQDGRKTGEWWLRSMGSSGSLASFVFNDGCVSAYGSFVDFVRVSVRPALWVKLE